MASIYDQPAAKPPPGQTSNLVDPPNQHYIFIVTVTVCLTLITLMVAIRMYVSAFVIRKFRWDDGLVFLCWISMIAYSTVAVEFTKYGGYTDIWNVSVGDIIHWKQLAYIEQILYSIFFCMIKVAVLVLYKRIFVPMRAKKNWVYYSIIILIAFNVLFYVANTLVRIFVCNPIQKAWDTKVPGTCVDVNSVMISTSSLNIISDIFILLIPVMVIRKLNMSWKRKAEIVALFAFGTLCFVSSVARLVFSVINLESPDPTIALMGVAAWTFGELTSSFLASCVPMVPRLWTHLQNKYSIPGSKRSSIAPMMPDGRAGFSPVSFPKKDSSKKPSLWSMVSVLRETQVEEEDPYLMAEVVSVVESDDTESQSEKSIKESDILVTKNVDITSLPRAQVTERDMNARYHLHVTKPSSG